MTISGCKDYCKGYKYCSENNIGYDTKTCIEIRAIK